ncbi:hypothetical protein ADL22_23995 [Streptomyces sp. NRRL F-4489]|uniref:hypothetical protein n=1 Tax=Streptomyces sp. NRRL F-4489 TaxID=1609095 RepID=UPI0007468749|nr:hypothetical protein [Streptomyces sp. NRRL F-4489]KUL36519.1 hypothetical protein ADL22_23995 [Streptomyces sp. NRRL F-4489]
MPQGPVPRWNPDTQSWETGPPRPARPYTGPMPPRPAAPPPPATAPGTAPSPAPSAPSDPTAPTASAPTAPGFPPGPPYTPWPGPGYGPDSAGVPGSGPEGGPGPESGGRRRVLVAGAVAAVVLAGAGGGYLLWGRGPDTPPAARPAASATATPAGTPTATASGPDSASPTPDASASSTAVPSGYRLVHDDKGFTLAVPEGWQRDLRSTGVFYTSPDDRSLLQIFQITEPDLTPRQALEQASKGLSRNPGYEELGIEPRPGPGGSDGAVLTYAYDSERLGIRVRAVDCAFTVPDGRQFAVLVLGPESDWPQQETIQRAALDSFVPSA